MPSPTENERTIQQQQTDVINLWRAFQQQRERGVSLSLVSNDDDRNDSILLGVRSCDERLEDNNVRITKRAKTTSSALAQDDGTKENSNNCNTDTASSATYIPLPPSTTNDSNHQYDVNVGPTTISTQRGVDYQRRIVMLSKLGPISCKYRDITKISQHKSSHFLAVRTATSVDSILSLGGSRPTGEEFDEGERWGFGEGVGVRYIQSSGDTFVFHGSKSTWYTTVQAAINDNENLTLDDIVSAPFNAQRALMETITEETDQGIITLSPPPPMECDTARLWISGITYDGKTTNYVTITCENGSISQHKLVFKPGFQSVLSRSGANQSSAISIDVNGISTTTYNKCVILYYANPVDGSFVILFVAHANNHDTTLVSWVHQQLAVREINIEELNGISGLSNVDHLTEKEGFYPRGLGSESKLKIKIVDKVCLSEDQFGPTNHPSTGQIMNDLATLVDERLPQTSQAAQELVQEVVANTGNAGAAAIMKRAGAVKQYYTEQDGIWKCNFCGLHTMKSWSGSCAKSHLRGEGGDTRYSLGTYGNPYPCTSIPEAIKAAIPAKRKYAKRK